MPETDFDAVVTEVMSADTPVQVKDAEGVMHTIRNPELCIVVYPGDSFRVTLENGSMVEEERKLPIEIPEGADDVESALASIVALRIAQIADQHNRQVIRVARVGVGPAIAAALREAGYYVLEFA
jgi:hypothetical protein